MVKPIPGNYTDNYQDPLADNMFAPFKTGKDGIISYKDIAFSVSGNLGTTSAVYEVQYRCGSGTTKSVYYTVKTSVARILLIQKMENYIQSNKANNVDFTNVLYIADKKNNGIQGKFIDKIEV